jgi:hypothetical protein
MIHDTKWVGSLATAEANERPAQSLLEVPAKDCDGCMLASYSDGYFAATAVRANAHLPDRGSTEFLTSALLDAR